MYEVGRLLTARVFRIYRVNENATMAENNIYLYQETHHVYRICIGHEVMRICTASAP